MLGKLLNIAMRPLQNDEGFELFLWPRMIEGVSDQAAGEGPF
jgi:hypothetical protein